MARRFFTSESVTEGHPDKVCDCVSDAILDAILEQDKEARVACETTCTTGVVTVMGEITTTAQIDFPAVIRKTVCDIGLKTAQLPAPSAFCNLPLQHLPDHFNFFFVAFILKWRFQINRESLQFWMPHYI